MESGIIAYVDKTVIKISGVKVKGLKPYELEENLRKIVGRPIRVIGVTGESIEMDAYGLEPEAVYKDENGIVKVIAATEGITAKDVIKIDSAKKAIEVSIDDVPRGENDGCAKERWLKFDK